MAALQIASWHNFYTKIFLYRNIEHVTNLIADNPVEFYLSKIKETHVSWWDFLENSR